MSTVSVLGKTMVDEIPPPLTKLFTSKCDNYIASGSVANQISIFDIRKPSKSVYEFAHNGKKKNPTKQRFFRGNLTLFFFGCRYASQQWSIHCPGRRYGYCGHALAEQQQGPCYWRRGLYGK
jgi:hypothetical protein